MPTQKRNRLKLSGQGPTYLTEGRAREIADEVVRRAVQEQARDLEEHLANIHDRLVKLEKR